MNKKAFLDSIIGRKLAYAIKSPDTELYDFGFGEEREMEDKRMLPPYILHVLCRFKIIHKDGSTKVQICHEDTTPNVFNKKIEPLIGLSVKRVGLSDKNDLWLDFGAYWVVFLLLKKIMMRLGAFSFPAAMSLILLPQAMSWNSSEFNGGLYVSNQSGTC